MPTAQILVWAGLNPFMNQVYFYRGEARTGARPSPRLNPFMNQVYFYRFLRQFHKRSGTTGLNPFMNQVYFYIDEAINIRQALRSMS